MKTYIFYVTQDNTIKCLHDPFAAVLRKDMCGEASPSELLENTETIHLYSPELRKILTENEVLTVYKRPGSTTMHVHSPELRKVVEKCDNEGTKTGQVYIVVHTGNEVLLFDKMAVRAANTLLDIVHLNSEDTAVTIYDKFTTQWGMFNMLQPIVDRLEKGLYPTKEWIASQKKHLL